jgi:hypothetical protein
MSIRAMALVLLGLSACGPRADQAPAADSAVTAAPAATDSAAAAPSDSMARDTARTE